MAPADTQIIPATDTNAMTNVVAMPKRPEPTTPSEKALLFVKQHPVLTIAGGVAAGLLISAIIPRRANRSLSKRAMRIAEAGAAAALSFGQDTLDKAEEGGVFARQKAKLFANQAEKFGDRASARAEKIGAIAAERLGASAMTTAERLGVAALGTASAFGHIAAERADKFGHAAAVRAENLGGRVSDRFNQLGDKALVQSSKLFGYPKVHASLAHRLLDLLHALRARLRS